MQVNGFDASGICISAMKLGLWIVSLKDMVHRIIIQILPGGDTTFLKIIYGQ